MAVTNWLSFNTAISEAYSDSNGNTRAWNGNDSQNNPIPLTTALNTLDSPDVITNSNPNNKVAVATGKIGDRSAYITFSQVSSVGIPINSVITGIEFMIHRTAPKVPLELQGENGTQVFYTIFGTDFDLKYSVDGGVNFSSNIASALNWIRPEFSSDNIPIASAYHGSSSSLFGLSVTPSNASNLIVRYAATATPSGAADDYPLAYLIMDYFAVRYHYTTDGTPSPDPQPQSRITTTIF